MPDPAVTSFRVEFDPLAIDDLRTRLRATRWPERETVDDWSQGAPLAFVQDLCTYWADHFDFAAAEDRLNVWPQFSTSIDDLGIHFVHARSPEADAMPLIITHGWPGSVVEFHDIIGPLTDPVAHGGMASDCVPRRVPVLARLRVQRQADDARSWVAVDRRRMGDADGAPRLRTIRGPRW